MASILSAIIAALLSLFGVHNTVAYVPPDLAGATSSQVAAAANPFEAPATSTQSNLRKATSDQTTPSQSVNLATSSPAAFTSANSQSAQNLLLATPNQQSAVAYGELPAPDYVTQHQLNAALLELSNSLTEKFTPTTAPTVPQWVAAGGNSAVPYAASNNISNLSGVTITNANLTASEIPALDYLSLGGGTLTGVLNVPSLNASTTNYGLITSTNSSTTNATSTNLFASIASFTTGLINTLSGATLNYTVASTTNLSNFGTAYFGGTATTTIDSAGDLSVAGNTTLTNATSTDFFAAVASSTSLYAQSASLGALSLGAPLAAGSGGTGIASTPSFGELLVGNGANYTLTATSSLGLPTFANLTSQVVAAYEFPQAGNGTSTLTQFNGGLTALASSTIGNGNQNGGTHD